MKGFKFNIARFFKQKRVFKYDQITPEYLLSNSRFKRSVHHSGTIQNGNYEEYYLYTKSRGLLFKISIRFRDNEIMIFGQRGSQMISFPYLTIDRFEKLMEVLKK